MFIFVKSGSSINIWFLPILVESYPLYTLNVEFNQELKGPLCRFVEI